jgi:fibronectin type 3 domain-containing protein
MRYIILIVCLIANLLQAEVVKDRLFLFANSEAKQIELKWFTHNYSSQYSYKIYRNSKGDKPKFLHTLKPESYEVLKTTGYDEDYIFMVYPYKNVKSFDDRIQVAKIEENVQAFRMLKLIRDRAFAKNLGQYFVDLNVKKDKLYMYTIEAYKGKKMVFQRSILAHTFKEETKRDFMWTRAKQSSGGLELSWDVSKEINYYNIYRKKQNEKKFTKINPDLMFISKEYAQKTRILYTDKDIKAGESATYYIRRIDMFAKEGTPSSHFKGEIKIAKKVKPSVVKNLFTTSTDSKIKIKWSKIQNVLGYNIYRSKIYQGNFKKINKKPIKKEVYFDKNFKSDKNYYYYVTAINMHGESKPSVTMLAYARDTTKPLKPTNLTAKVSAGLVSLQWMKVKDDNLVGYRVYVSMDEDASQWSLINKEILKTNSYEHNRSKTLSRFPYYYRVSAVDKTFNESFPSKIVKTKLSDVTAPNQPFIKKFRAYTAKITLEWSKIVVYDMEGYNVYRKTDKKLIKLNKTLLKNSIFIDTKPLKGANEYVIAAVDASGNESVKKDSRVIYLKDIKPVKIENFKLSKTKDGIKATFTCSDTDYAGFKLFRSSGEIVEYFNVSNFVKSKSYTDKSISKKTTYFYVVKAYDKAGNISESEVKSMRVEKK